MSLSDKICPSHLVDALSPPMCVFAMDVRKAVKELKDELLFHFENMKAEEAVMKKIDEIFGGKLV